MTLVVWPRCCGSVVPYATTRPTGQLSRTVTVGVMDLMGGDRSLSHIPPSRIGNLRAVVNSPAQQITFYWTAPGDQRDHGTGESLDWIVKASKVK